MDKRVYLLTIVSFVVGMVELIIGGILDIVATDLGVSVGQAGLLITIFSVTFAISAPILSVLTAKIERKRLTLVALFIFLVGNLVAVVSPSFSVLFISRIISAGSSSLLIVLCVVMAANIVQPQYRARAIGIVNMGVSGSLVLGIPFGLMLGNTFGWRAPFIFISGLSILSIAGIYFFMGRVAPTPQVSIGKQLASLKNHRILFAQLTSVIFLTGHSTLYSFLTPFVKTTLGLDGSWISIIYLIFGISALSGGAIGGTLADRFGEKPTILSLIVIFGVAIFSIPYSTFALPLFLTVLVIWGMMSWAITPPMQSYLMGVSPETANIQISLNNSAVHLGIAFGSLIGGVVIDRSSVEMNPTVGGMFVIVALCTGLISMAKGRKRALIKT